MERSNQLVVFSLEDQRYALYLSAVERIVRMVEITPLPKAPEVVLGIVEIRGEIVPVINIRRRFRLPEREINLDDQLIFARTAKRRVALVADSVSGTAEISGEQIISPEKIVPGTKYVEAVVKLGDGIVLIHDLDKFLSLEEEQDLDDALSTHGSTAI